MNQEQATMVLKALDVVHTILDDECDGDRPELFDRLEVIAHDAATDGWASSDSVGVMISACK